MSKFQIVQNDLSAQGDAQRFAFAIVQGIHCWSCPVEMPISKMIIKLPKNFIERVQPQTTAAMLLL